MTESRSHHVAVGTGGPMGPPASGLSTRPAAAERAGYASIWWGDHYMGWVPSSIWTPDIAAVARPGSNPDVFFDSVAAMAVAGTVTSSVSIGVTTDSIRRHPVALAQQFLTLQHITGDRAILGLGAGEGENLLPYAFSFERPVGRMEEGLRIIRLLWENDAPIDFDGEHYVLRDAVLGLSVLEGKSPELWVLGMGPRMCRITGELGDGWLPAMQTPAEYAERLRIIEKARAAAGRSDDPFTRGLFAFAVIAESLDAAERLLQHPYIKGMCLMFSAASYERFGAAHPLGATVNGMTEYIPARVGRDEALSMIAAIPDDLVRAHILHGSPDDVRRQIAPFAEAGLEHVVIQNIAPLADPQGARESFALMDELAGGMSFDVKATEATEV